MNLITQKMARISTLYLTVMHNASTNRQNKGSHHTVNKAPGFVHLFGVCRPPLASLCDGRKDDFHLRELPVEVLQVLLDSCNKLDTLDGTEVVPATVNQEDVWHSSSSKALVEEEGEDVSPNHASPAKPPDMGVQPKVGPDRLPGMFFPTVNVAVPNYVYSGSC